MALHSTQTADIVFRNGTIITVNSRNEIAQAVAVKGNRILYCGNENDICKFTGPETKVINLNGRTLMPGFIDSHIHFSVLGLKKGPMIDITYEKAQSIEDIKGLIREAALQKAPGKWIVLSGYDHNKLREKRHPIIEELDEAAPENPVRCIRCCAHMGVYNSMALRMGGISHASQYEDGEIDIKDGNLTGLLKENAHMYMGGLVEFAEDELYESIKIADNEMLRYGITTVCDAGADGIQSLLFMRDAANSREIKTRIRAMIFDLAGKQKNLEAIQYYMQNGLNDFPHSEYFGIGPMKIMLDGSSSGPSSATRQPYSHDLSMKGILVWNQEEVNEVVQNIHDSGFQATAHAVGDRAVEIMVNAIEQAQQKNPKKNVRHRIEHCGIADQELIARIKELEIIPIANPGFIERNGKDYNRFYGDRVNDMFPLQSFLRKKIPVAIGSDAPVVSANPMFGLYGAIHRCDGFTNDPVGKTQIVDILDAIRMYTYQGAYACFEEENLGSIEPGKLADMIVLSDNILNPSTKDIRTMKVCMTMIDGEIVFQD